MTRMRSADDNLVRKTAVRLALVVAAGVTATVLAIRISVPMVLTILFR